jgi:hypothetical protein
MFGLSLKELSNMPVKGIVWLIACLVIAGLFISRALPYPNHPKNEGVEVTPVAVTTRDRSVPLKSIERIRVGERVAMAENPAEPFDASLGDKVDPQTWRKILLRVDKTSGGSADVILLRPQWWIDERLDNSSQSITLTVPELGIDDKADVLGIEPCPTISAGHGSVVIGTFAHESPATVRLFVDGLAEPIQCTPGHPIWSEDRQAFIEAQQFVPGEHLRGRGHSLHSVTSVVRDDSSAAVYNLEIHGQHVYEVSALKLLVHNAPSSPGRMQREVERGQAPRDIDRVDPGHIPGQEPHVHYTDGTSSTVSGGVHDAHKGIPTPSKAARRWLESHEWIPPPKS